MNDPSDLRMEERRRFTVEAVRTQFACSSDGVVKREHTLSIKLKKQVEVEKSTITFIPYVFNHSELNIDQLTMCYFEMKVYEPRVNHTPDKIEIEKMVYIDTTGGEAEEGENNGDKDGNVGAGNGGADNDHSSNATSSFQHQHNHSNSNGAPQDDDSDADMNTSEEYHEKENQKKDLEISNLQADLSRQAALIRKQGQELQDSKNYQAHLKSRAAARIRSEQAKNRQEMANKENAQHQANPARNAAEAELIRMKSVHFEAQEKIEVLDAQKSKDEH
jgi:hypothetical protein